MGTESELFTGSDEAKATDQGGPDEPDQLAPNPLPYTDPRGDSSIYAALATVNASPPTSSDFTNSLARIEAYARALREFHTLAVVYAGGPSFPVGSSILFRYRANGNRLTRGTVLSVKWVPGHGEWWYRLQYEGLGGHTRIATYPPQVVYGWDDRQVGRREQKEPKHNLNRMENTNLEYTEPRPRGVMQWRTVKATDRLLEELDELTRALIDDEGLEARGEAQYRAYKEAQASIDLTPLEEGTLNVSDSDVGQTEGGQDSGTGANGGRRRVGGSVQPVKTGSIRGVVRNSSGDNGSGV